MSYVSAECAGIGRRRACWGLVPTEETGAAKTQRGGGDWGRSLDMTVEHSCVPFAAACVALALVLGG